MRFPEPPAGPRPADRDRTDDDLLPLAPGGGFHA